MLVGASLERDKDLAACARSRVTYEPTRRPFYHSMNINGHAEQSADQTLQHQRENPFSQVCSMCVRHIPVSATTVISPAMDLDCNIGVEKDHEDRS